MMIRIAGLIAVTIFMCLGLWVFESGWLVGCAVVGAWIALSKYAFLE